MISEMIKEKSPGSEIHEFTDWRACQEHSIMTKTDICQNEIQVW